MDSPRSTLVHHLLDERAALTPDAIAVVHGPESWTYAHVRQASTGYAHWLRSRGVTRGDRVVIAASRASNTVALVYAISRLGALYVIVDEKLGSFVLRQIADDCEPRLVVVNGTPPPGVRDAFGDCVEIPEWRTLTDDGPLPAAPCLSVDPVSLIYTSGSTAAPKAVVSAHREVIFSVRAIQARLGYRNDDTVFCCLPLSFDYGLYQAYLACVSGAALVLGDAGAAGPPLLTALLHHRATILPALPTLATILVMLLGRSGKSAPGLRMVTNTGAALSPALTQQLRTLLPQAKVVPMFGLTECKRVTIAPVDDADVPAGSAGTALPDTEIFVVDENDRRLPPGEVGQLVVRGPNVMSGYWRAPAETARQFRVDEFGVRSLYTGDQCRIDAKGHLYFVGRQDEVYKQQGIRISAAQVEAAALDITGINGAALLPPDGDRGALLVVTGGLNAETVMIELRERLGRARLPQDCRVLETLPVRANGKIDKRALLETFDAPVSVGATTRNGHRHD
ncbi:class I adenylate-forming enzyme family protein [Micromonospora sp. ZYX-F-536]|uniref:class I adenylate-forming enzyme family protein n=1 Tax=Micromonospora sp. ZYX-F-536 TaxID=3457629 RepID=UPI004040C745